MPRVIATCGALFPQWPFAAARRREADAVGAADDSGWSATVDADGVVADSADRAVGIAVFLEKRDPVWLGH